MTKFITPDICKMVIVALACAASPLAAQARVDITDIWQNFVISRIAAEECHALDKATDEHFLANLLDVKIRAAQRLQERSPSTTLNAVGTEMKFAEDQLRVKVTELIHQNSCHAENVQQLLKMYKMHSTMSF